MNRSYFFSDNLFKLLNEKNFIKKLITNIIMLEENFKCLTNISTYTFMYLQAKFQIIIDLKRD